MAVWTVTNSWMLTSRMRMNLGRILVVLTTILAVMALIALILSIYTNRELHDHLIDTAPEYRTFSRILIADAFILLILNALGAKMLLDISRSRTQCRWMSFAGLWSLAVSLIIFLTILAAMLAFVMRTGVNRVVQKGMRKAMDVYAVNIQVKAFVDELQMTHKCCGGETYADWFCTQWVDLKYCESTMGLTKEGTTDSVPFSCCDPAVFHPCVHYQITQAAKHSPLAEKGLSIYKPGCGHVIGHTLGQILTILSIGLLMAVFIQLAVLILARYLVTSAFAANAAGEPEGAACGHLLSSWRPRWFSKEKHWSDRSRPSSRATGGTSADSLGMCSSFFSSSTTEARESPPIQKERLRSGHEDFGQGLPPHVFGARFPSLRPVLPCRLRPNLSPLL